MKPQRNVLFSIVTAVMLVLPLMIFSFSLPTQKADAQTTESTIQLNNIRSVPWGKDVIVTGKLTDNAASGAGVAGKTITFDGTGADNLPDAITNADGTFISNNPATDSVFTGWKVQAHFAGDSSLGASDSVIKSYNTLKHAVTLVVTSKASIIWGQPNTFTATLKDASLGGVPISGKTIHFDGTGVIGVSDQVTDSNGKATGTGNSPNSVASGWTYQAHFAGDSLYTNRDSTVKTYSTTKHGTTLTIAVSPSTVVSDNTYKVSGVLKDSTLGTVLSSKKITITADAPITISDETTDSAGRYSADGLQAPDDAGTYNIQTHYAGDSLYNARDSAIRTLTVTAEAVAADTEASTTSPESSSDSTE